MLIYGVWSGTVWVFAGKAGFCKPQFKPAVTARLYVFLALKTGYMRACLAYVATSQRFKFTFGIDAFAKL